MTTLRPPLFRASFDAFPGELFVDNFAGGGGASSGIRAAIGRDPDIAINHDPEALALHAANHPGTLHVHGDVWDVNPRELCGGRKVGAAWFSPDCTFHSKARGGKPNRDRNAVRKRRGLAHVAIRWAREVRPRIIFLENVEEFEDWGPLLENGQPCPDRRGLSFRIWLGKLKAQGYHVEMRQLRACDYGAPTSRKRLFIIARCDGLPIVWPAETHGPKTSQPYRTAAEIIDWSIECPSIFLSGKDGQRLGVRRPLADKTLARIARGIQRFVLGAAKPFIVPVTHAGDLRVHSIGEPVRTITGAHRGELALCAPTLIQTGYGERPGQTPRAPGLGVPLGTCVAGGQKHALVSAFLAKHYGGHESAAGGSSSREPLSTVTTRDHHALVAAHLLKLRGSSVVGQDLRAPAPTITAGGTHLAEVRAFLTRFNGTGEGQDLRSPLGTVTTRDRFGLVMIAGEAYEIADIGMRMLQPRELFRAQGFRDDYVIDKVAFDVLTGRGKKGRRLLTKGAQVRMCGNSVSPPVACALVAANALQGAAAA